MTETGFQLMSPLEMLERYQRAPLSGELTKGGLSSAKSDGKPCFARLNGEINSNEYSLEIIISNYASVSSTITPQKCKSILTDYCSYASRELFSTINIINIYLARAKQLGSVDISPTAYVPRLDRGIQ